MIQSNILYSITNITMQSRVLRQKSERINQLAGKKMEQKKKEGGISLNPYVLGFIIFVVVGSYLEMNTIVKQSTSTLYSAAVSSSLGFRFIAGAIKKNQPIVRRTTCILSNGATIPIYTSMPYAEVWRSSIDSYNTKPDHQFDSKSETKKKKQMKRDSRFQDYKN
ncbi:hypothetical protein DFA_03582 [Cavenderia fasciculata]|uniref:Transmembrane protein n=1 Tax=Cavenderia fasciculata TaxID=261658 RepID=F4PI50_CACFS|nr:uncharacterized protein DFA_03582 [Cavenderia fasciculata]EGG25333.1 hypothetical protein DFA_03582 [Cavenderia fasciculata]|eukprot:XP_004363184.1 hypothetical protein DFA_03582 [Cavenderia fasciculata]